MEVEPNKWQDYWPEHAEEIADATQGLISAVNRLTITTGDPMVEAAAVEWVIEQLRSFIAAELDAELRFRRPDEL